LLLGTFILSTDRIDKENAQELLNQGNQKLKEKLFTEAILDYDKAIKLDPDLKQVYNRRGLAKFYLNNFPAAIIDYDKAIALDDKFVEAYYNKGLANYGRRNYRSCIVDFDKVIELDEKDADAHFMRGVAKTFTPEISIESACADFHKAKELGYKAKRQGDPDADFMIVKFCAKEE
jgi:tetratricopeptide (TPR) repeat protein